VLRALWTYRHFIVGMARRELAARYLGSALGSLWHLLNPLALVAIYMGVFAGIMRGKLPGSGDALGYALYLCIGIISWTYFADVLLRSQTVFVENANLLKKLSFPRTSLPLITLIVASVHFFFAFLVFVAVLLAFGRFPGVAIIGLLPLLALQQGIAVGLGILLGTTHVFLRDAGQVTQILVQLWFWGTPVVYHPSILPETFRGVVGWNPLFELYTGYHRVVLEGLWPEWHRLAVPGAAAALLLALGWVTFRALSDDLVDEL